MRVLISLHRQRRTRNRRNAGRPRIAARWGWSPQRRLELFRIIAAYAARFSPITPPT